MTPVRLSPPAEDLMKDLPVSHDNSPVLLSQFERVVAMLLLEMRSRFEDGKLFF